MIDLAEGQIELLESSAEDADGLLMGAPAPVTVRAFDPGSVDIRDADAERQLADGVAFGRDFRGGRLLSLELTALSWTPALATAGYGASPGAEPAVEALNWADRVESAWAADRIRLVPGAVQVLRWKAGGRVRRVYGRSRKCSPVVGSYRQGVIPLTADFRAEDDLIYADDRKVTSVQVAPASNAWATWPLEWPVLWRNAPAGPEGTVIVGGTRATWPSFTIRGPIVNPTVVFGGYGELRLNTTLLYDQTVYIDTRPWNRGIRRENGANLAGALDTRATPLSLLRIPPGSYSVALKGTDPTGTAQLVVEHRDAFSSI